MEVYTNADYSKSYTELIEILRYVSKEDLAKIPQDLLKFYIRNRDKNYKFNYDLNLQFENQNIMKLTTILIANLYIKYWATEERKQEIQKEHREEQYKIEMRKKELYNTDNLFKKRECKKQECIEEKGIAIISKKGVIDRILDKLKKWLKLT